ncbi:LytR/AlgR family response regulator transcription factor [Spirosoma linguale]|uniref:Two component transcriptional regulator, LytTR family n=1 Tax=Spirosoma linguale (strain ATCC 33905 / DSM 74 / LMG 10896 / Claus 1) TaxID=504472 RepID=D2QI70_SPILD|nr:two component transcriptional regulator, LytTR family [Spirosoma linguale DSM 74]
MEQRTYSCLVVDDEPLAQNLIEKFVDRLQSLRMIGKANHAVAAMEAIEQYRPDIVFLDITMPEMTGFELLQTFSANRPQIIITTAHTELAVDGYTYDVTDYLIKPIPFDRFMRSINRAIDRINGVKMPIVADSKIADGQYFWIKEGTKLLQINTDDVVFMEGLKDYVKIHLADRIIVTYLTMNKMEELLPKGQFLRINRSYLVRKKAIKAIQGNTIETINKQEVTIGLSYRAAVLESLRNTFIGRTVPE